MTEREDHVYKAKLAEQAERYDGKPVGCGHRRTPFLIFRDRVSEMVAAMKTVASLDVELTVEERNLVSGPRDAPLWPP